MIEVTDVKQKPDEDDIYCDGCLWEKTAKLAIKVHDESRTSTITTFFLCAACARDLRYKLSIDPVSRKPLDVTCHNIVSAMERHGGRFVRALANAWQHADQDNKVHLQTTFSHYFAEYAHLARANQQKEKDL